MLISYISYLHPLSSLIPHAMFETIKRKREAFLCAVKEGSIDLDKTLLSDETKKAIRTVY